MSLKSAEMSLTASIFREFNATERTSWRQQQYLPCSELFYCSL